MKENNKKLPLFLTQNELDLLIKKIKKKKHKTGLALMAYAGLRVSEVCNLKVSDINFQREYIKVFGKGSKERFVPMPAKLHSIVTSFIEHNKNIYPDSLLVGGTRVAWHYVVKKYSSIVLLRSDVHCHTLRHSYATALYEKGVQLEKISELLGHSKLDTTMIYSHISIDNKKEAVSVLDSKSEKFTKIFSFFSKKTPDLKIKNRGKLVGREKETREIKKLMETGKSIILFGPVGSGKSAVLKSFSNSIYITDYKKKKTLIEIILNSKEDLDAEVKIQLAKELKKSDIEALIEMIAAAGKLIIFDDITTLSKTDKKVISDLSNHTQVFSATSRKADIRLFDTYVVINPLNRYHTRLVLSEMIYTPSPRTKERIVDDLLHTSGDNLKQAEYLANQLQFGKSTDNMINETRENNQVSITPLLLVMVLFFCSFAIKSYAPTYVALSYAFLVVFRIVFYKFLFAPVMSKKRTNS